MYKNALDNMNKLSEKIQSGEFNQQQKAKRQSMIPRPVQRPERSTAEPEDDRNEQQKVIDHFMEIREMNKKLLTDVEKGAINGESAEGGKPKGTSSKTGGGKGTTPVKGGGSGLLLMDLIDETEAGGDYTTLFGYSQRDGKKFAGVDVTQMTIGELKEFANGEYGQWSKEQLGYKATPMGRYQIVGTTLNRTAKQMGLDDDTKFTPEVQDAMFTHLAKQNIDNLRGTWEGLKHVSDSQLEAAREELRGVS